MPASEEHKNSFKKMTDEEFEAFLEAKKKEHTLELQAKPEEHLLSIISYMFASLECMDVGEAEYRRYFEQRQFNVERSLTELVITQIPDYGHQIEIGIALLEIIRKVESYVGTHTIEIMKKVLDKNRFKFRISIKESLDESREPALLISCEVNLQTGEVDVNMTEPGTN